MYTLSNAIYIVDGQLDGPGSLQFLSMGQEEVKSIVGFHQERQLV